MDDSIAEEIRRIRDELSRKFNYDVHATCEDLRAQEAQLKDRRIISVEESIERARTAAPSKM